MKAKYFLIISILIFSLFGCQDDFLEQKPISSYSSTNMWQTSDEANAGVLSIYSSLGNSLDMNYCYWGEARAAHYVKTPTGMSQLEPMSLVGNSLQQTFNSADWSKLYRTIMLSNTALEKIMTVPDPKLTEAARKDLMGEAYFLRALAYFYIVRIWGDAPLIINTIKDPNNKQEIYIAREKSEKVWAQIISDLDNAEIYIGATDRVTDNNLANFITNRSRVTRPAIWAMKTDVFLWQKNYSKAIENADKFLTANRFFGNGQYKLTSKANWPFICQRRDASVFTNLSTLPYESIFEIGFSYNDEYSHGTYRNSWHMGLNYFSPTTTFMNLFNDPGDDVRVTMYSEQLFKIYKYKGIILTAGAADAIPNDQPMIIYRLTDLVLMHAEALNRRNQSGDRAKAIQLLQIVRKRAGCSESTLAVNANSTMDQIELEILAERGRELLGEGKVWFDLRRTGRVIEILGPINGFSNQNYFLWPIHTDRLKEYPSGLITQNPGYGD